MAEIQHSREDAASTAIRLLADHKLHRSLWLPATTSHDRLRVTFATTSNFDNDKLPAILFAGPMFGTRYLALTFDRLARENDVRVICIDRPAMGGSSPVDIDQRMEVWLETVPAVLRHLDVNHVSIISHSAGTIYALNTLSRLRYLLDPKTPYVALLAPWVHNEHSKITLLNLASKLPIGAFSYWSSITEFVNQKIMPTTSWSGGLSSSVVGLFQAQPGTNHDGQSAPQGMYGVDKDTEQHIDRLTGKYIFTEGMTGANHEAILCLKRAGPKAWLDCNDYMHYVQKLSAREAAHVSSNSSKNAKLRISVHFAGSDIMIGAGGREYFEKCWAQDGVTESVDFSSTVWAEANHDSVLVDFEKGAVKNVLEEVHRLHPEIA